MHDRDRTDPEEAVSLSGADADPSDPHRDGGADARLARMLEAEQLARNRLTARAVTGALAVIAPVVLWLAGFPEGLFHVALMPLFAGSVWLQYRLARRHGAGSRHAYLFVALNFALLTVALILPNPFADPPVPATMMLRLGNAIYLFVMLAALAFSFSPRMVLWGGLCAAAFWSAGRALVLARPGVTADVAALPPAPAEWGANPVLRGLHPAYLDPGVWAQEVVVILTVAGMLALVVRGSRRLVLRQARLERRGANLARYLPVQLAERMAEADAPFARDREAVAAILFTDIVGFTGWAETRPPGEVMRLLREAHALVAEAVFRAGGVLDKFIGDGAMASFGAAGSAAPGRAQEPGESARRAFDCAEAILDALAAWNRARAKRGETPVRLSIGLHLGPVVVGDVGSSGRMELATVGDSVNVASRLEALTRELGCAACASGAAMAAACAGEGAGRAPRPGWVSAGHRTLPGRAEATPVWIRAV
ncbi:MAG: adenylate/guanylate cyclase domain-containing protein [Pseudomonadota bacterium]|nr:adenylate/guanylate cyclase domain-containing protein [Pseudomonadota bacterium]